MNPVTFQRGIRPRRNDLNFATVTPRQDHGVSKCNRMKVLFSGIQASGNLHIGNYLGAIKQFLTLQDSYKMILGVMDEHAVTVPQDPKELHANTLAVAALYLAAGMDPKKSVIFVQSHVPAHTELGWILNTLTPLGELERMTQFKVKAGGERRTAVYAGLLNYPTLMAADILLYHAHKVPVGEDQIQHIELTRSLAERFNNRFGKTLTVPEPFIRKETTRVMDLDDPSKKMSKSAPHPSHYIALLDSPSQIREKIKTAVTDSEKKIRYDEIKKPAVSNLIRIYGGFADLTHAQVEKKYRGKGYAEFKDDLAEILIRDLSLLQERYRGYAKNKNALIAILHEGARRANAIAQKTLREVKKKMGFVNGPGL